MKYYIDTTLVWSKKRNGLKAVRSVSRTRTALLLFEPVTLMSFALRMIRRIAANGRKKTEPGATHGLKGDL